MIDNKPRFAMTRARAWVWACLVVAAMAAPAAAQTPPVAAVPPASVPVAGPAATPSRVPPPPADIGAAKAYSTLERNCARCHQDGRLKENAPARGLANILALDEIARDPGLVSPGVPDASRLYTLMLSRRMPPDVAGAAGPQVPVPPTAQATGAPTASATTAPAAGTGTAPGAAPGQSATQAVVEPPTNDEIQAVRDWIQQLPVPPSPPSTSTPASTSLPENAWCAGRQPLDQDAIAANISRALTDAGPDKSRMLRFVSLATLYNGCASSAELAGFRQAVTHLVNSLSWSAAPVRLEALGAEQAIIKLDMSAVGWIAAHWEQLAAHYPLRWAPSAIFPQSIVEATGSRTPVLPADWLASAALRSPLYHELLGLPGRASNLQRILRVDVDNDIRHGLARRAGVTQSGETRAARIIERHPSMTGAMWLTYDFLGGNGRQNMLEHPLGPATIEPSRAPFRHDGMRSLFQLPNGFVAFSTLDAHGERIEGGASDADRDAGTPAGCLQCHRSGPIAARDEVRAFVDADRTAQKELREAVHALYPPEPELAQLAEADQAKVVAAQVAAGIDPTLRIRGLEPMHALAHAWQRRVDLRRAAADFGAEPKALLEQLASVGDDQQVTARMLRQGTARRRDVERVLEQLAGGASPRSPTGQGSNGQGSNGQGSTGQGAPGQATSGSPATAASGPAPAGTANGGDGIDLAIWSDADSYVAGQAITLYAQASQDCNLTVIDVDHLGRATVLFPNEFEQNNRISGHREHRLPNAESPYRFRLKERGRETFVAICLKSARSPEGVFHDFDRLRFSVLGDWQIFLREPPALEEARRDDAANDRPGPQKRGRKPVPVPRPASSDIEARTAIVVDVK